MFRKNLYLLTICVALISCSKIVYTIKYEDENRLHYIIKKKDKFCYSFAPKRILFFNYWYNDYRINSFKDSFDISYSNPYRCVKFDLRQNQVTMNKHYPLPIFLLKNKSGCSVWWEFKTLQTVKIQLLSKDTLIHFKEQDLSVHIFKIETMKNFARTPLVDSSLVYIDVQENIPVQFEFYECIYDSLDNRKIVPYKFQFLKKEKRFW